MTTSTRLATMSQLTRLSIGEIIFLLLASLALVWPGYYDVPELITWKTYAIPSGALIVSWFAVLWGYRCSPWLALTILAAVVIGVWWSDTSYNLFLFPAWLVFRSLLDRHQPVIWLLFTVVSFGIIAYFAYKEPLTNVTFTAMINLWCFVAGGLVGAGGLRLRQRIENRERERHEIDMTAYREQVLRDIHDTVSPALAGLGLQAELGANSDLKAEEIRQILTKVHQDARATHTKLRHSLAALRFGDGYLARPINELVATAETDGLRVTGNWQLPEKATNNALASRLVAELLANAKRYAADSMVELAITEVDGQLLVYSNNLTNTVVNPDGHGLSNLAHLLESAGGSLAWGAVQGVFTVQAEVPVEEESPISTSGGAAK